jgi:alkanesulfonate monooxygenase SsuD/methylene tetrahydromethanopterin reductase-like flavin-dependent oxidoreductase (luciferase family)
MNDHSHREASVTVQVGMSVTAVDDIVGMAQRLEELGYDYVGVGEHIGAG